MNLIEALVDRTYVINLAKRTDRWESVTKQLASIGHEQYERFDAYGMDHLPPGRYTAGLKDFQMSGWWGNKFSHYGVIEAARDAGLQAVLVLEDDVLLHPHFGQFFGYAFRQLPEVKWDWLQFGGNHRWVGRPPVETSTVDGRRYDQDIMGLEPATPNLARIKKMLTAHAYIVRRPVYQFILDHAIGSPLSIDGFYAHEVHPKFACYTVYPHLATQAAGVNDIGNVYSDYSWFIGD